MFFFSRHHQDNVYVRICKLFGVPYVYYCYSSIKLVLDDNCSHNCCTASLFLNGHDADTVTFRSNW